MLFVLQDPEPISIIYYSQTTFIGRRPRTRSWVEADHGERVATPDAVSRDYHLSPILLRRNVKRGGLNDDEQIDNPGSAHLPQVIEIKGLTKDMFYRCQIHKFSPMSQGLQQLTATNSREMYGTRRQGFSHRHCDAKSLVYWAQGKSSFNGASGAAARDLRSN